ncbi:MAG: hypothetical protein H6826_05050 [Planctomycetes bacterium]|nr:hypothetical protein [Planctomycetota bacterium]MCB9825899.1 hypothetical protein [Planctomycetota bacterium]MCB9900703.1 hypothetical protein [Planctomycetota bacterium]
MSDAARPSTREAVRDDALARRERAEVDRASAEARAARLGTLRVVTFALAVAAGLLVPAPWTLPAVFLALAGFAALIVASGRVGAAERAAAARMLHADHVLARVAGEVPEGAFDATPLLQAAWRETAQALHVAGPRGLLARLGRPRTHRGAQELVALAMTSPTAEERSERQQRTDRLAAEPDLLETWAVTASDAPQALGEDRVATWVGAPRRALDGPWRVAVEIACVVDVALVVAWFADAPTGFLGALGGMVLHHLVWRPRARHVTQALAASEAPARELSLASRLAPLVAERPDLVGADVAERMRHEGTEASRLGRLAGWVESLRNPFALPFVWITGSGTRLARRLERWRAERGQAALAWLAELGAFDATTAVATYAREHPEDAWAEPGATRPARLEARGVRHPLLPHESSVANDIVLGAPDPSVLVVSGANMAGKSTWLRALGLNEVLARLGAPVAAAAWHGGPFGLGTSLGVDDDLLAGVSRFQAEVVRTALLVREAREHAPYLALLDELFGGTTSEDRVVGATAVVEHLLAAGALALVTTHDLALTHLADDEPRVGNVHFAADVTDGQLHFDHRVRPGVVSGSSARALLQAAGLLPADA